MRESLIDSQIFVTYQHQLKHLGIQESRLRAQRDKDLADLKDMQKTREGHINQQVHAIEILREEQ